MCWELIAIFNFLKIRMRVDIFRTEKCKVTFGLEYIKVARVRKCLRNWNNLVYSDVQLNTVPCYHNHFKNGSFLIRQTYLSNELHLS